MIGYLLLLGFGAGLTEIGILFSFRRTGAPLACAVIGFPLMVRAMRLSAATVRIIGRRIAATSGVIEGSRSISSTLANGALRGPHVSPRFTTPRHWVIERTFGRIARCRRLARDAEATPSSALAFFVSADAMILVGRLALRC